MPALALAPRVVMTAQISSLHAPSCRAKRIMRPSSSATTTTSRALSLSPSTTLTLAVLSPSPPPPVRKSQRRRQALLPVRAGEGGDADPESDESERAKADETSSAFQKELARRASGGKGPPERAPSGRPRWAPDAIRGERPQQPPPPPPPAMNRGGPVPEQLQNSRDLVNEGLSGLVPRARVLLQVGAAIPTAFVGLIAVAVCVFAVLALGLEDKFIHGGKPVSSPPEVIDPYSLLDPYPREGPYLGFRE